MFRYTPREQRLASSVPRTYDGRQEQGRAQKAESARAACALLEPDQVVIVDGGSAAALLVEEVPMNFAATFVTHSPGIASALIARYPAGVVLIGGRIDPSSRAAVGSLPVEAYARISADLCFLGLWGVDLKQGLSSPYYDESLVRRAMVDAANRVVGLAVADKIGTRGPFTVAPITALTHMSIESTAPEELTRPFEEAGVRVLRPPVDDGQGQRGQHEGPPAGSPFR